jgi:tetratricopeptide (TPR) repeat protein
MIVAELAAVVGVSLGPNLENRVLNALADSVAVVVLDNAETPWEADTLGVEEFISKLAFVPGLALMTSLRGAQRPLGPRWRESIYVPPLVDSAAREVFLAVAGRRYKDDPRLSGLVGALDGVPLAIELLGLAAEGEPSLEALASQWERQRVGMLERTVAPGQHLSVAVSFEVSINSQRMTNEGRRLLSLLGLLPDGVRHDSLGSLLPECGEVAAATLRRVGLAFDSVGRLRALQPVRDHVYKEHPPCPADTTRAITHYASLAQQLGRVVGAQGGAEASRLLVAETGNIEATLLLALQRSAAPDLIAAAIAMADFTRLSGVGSLRVLKTANEAAHHLQDPELEARTLLSLGDIAFYRSQHAEAEARYKEARSLYQRIDHVRGVADCIKRLGDIALYRSPQQESRRRYQEARVLYQQAQDHVGEADCLKGLGDIARIRASYREARSAYDEARQLYKRGRSISGEADCVKSVGDNARILYDLDGAERAYDEARKLYQSVGFVRGEGDCIKGLGDLALMQGDASQARARFEEARPFYQQVGFVRGEANCVHGLADAALAHRDLEEGLARYHEAWPLYQEAGDILGEARCIHGIGNVVLLTGDVAAAEERYRQAFPLYERVNDVLGRGDCISGLAEVALARSDVIKARAEFERALEVYTHANDPVRVGHMHTRIASLATKDPDRARHTAAATVAWQSVDRRVLPDPMHDVTSSGPVPGATNDEGPSS